MWQLLRKKLDREQAKALAQQVCQENSWLYLDPVDVIPGLLSWTIVTNAGRIGCSARIKVSKRSGEVVRKAFLLR